jgi:hypothetical protein
VNEKCQFQNVSEDFSGENHKANNKDCFETAAWGQCNDHNFQRFLAIFDEKWRFSQKPML